MKKKFRKPAARFTFILRFKIFRRIFSIVSEDAETKIGRLVVMKNGKKVFKILSIDGGGIKGLFSAQVLSEIERVNGSIAEHFDLLCGTSTGGLIALALASGKSAVEVRDFYREWGPKIFPGRNLFYKAIQKTGFLISNSKNTDTNLKAAVAEIVGSKRMCESNSYLCIPTLNLINSAPYVYKTDHDVTLDRDANVLMSDVALATSAAPFYFPVAGAEHIPDAAFVDGGLWANNPTLVGMIEAARFFVGEDKPYDELAIFSLASIAPAAGRAAGGRRKLNVFFSAKEIFSATLESQQRATEFAVKFLIPSMKFPVRYLRIPSPSVSVEHCTHLGLDNASPTALNTLQNYGNIIAHDWHTKPDIKSFFEEKAAPPIFREIKE